MNGKKGGGQGMGSPYGWHGTSSGSDPKRCRLRDLNKRGEGDGGITEDIFCRYGRGRWLAQRRMYVKRTVEPRFGSQRLSLLRRKKLWIGATTFCGD